MKLYPRFVIIFVSLIAILAVQSFAGDNTKLSKRLVSRMRAASVKDNITVWVFFTDKGNNTAQQLEMVKQKLLPQARKRRLRNRPSDRLVDYFDIPVNSGYITEVSKYAKKIRHKSRWLNAVSIETNKDQIEMLSRLSFVKSIRIVYQKSKPLPIKIGDKIFNHTQPSALENLNYGPSFDQNNQINTIPLHNMGYNGSGVLVAMLDAGFNNLEHEALQHLDILHTWDFVNGDSIVWDEPGQMGTGNHGTYTLSALAGFKEGQLIGPAYGASFLLAKTENTDYERHIEEDHWVAGAEWADSLGADIISSSLGYRDGFTSPDTNYTWQDMDGNTTIVTIGADIAASRGILVVNSAGNEGPASGGMNTLVAPSDGDSVLAVGAVNSSGSRASFSSMGPTADGRIKPDVMARGVNTYCASPWDTSGYLGVGGTSLSCPLVAGASALVLQVDTTLSNMQIIDALRSTASQAQNPNNEYGWGIINTYNAAFYFTGIKGEPHQAVKEYELLTNYPNPFNPETTIRYRIGSRLMINLSIFNHLGQKIVGLKSGFEQPGEHEVLWDASNLASGVYYIVLRVNSTVTVQKAILLK